MKLYKQLRRERTLARFHIQTKTQWNAGRKPRTDLCPRGTYEEYVSRKEAERKALMR